MQITGCLRLLSRSKIHQPNPTQKQEAQMTSLHSKIDTHSLLAKKTRTLALMNNLVGNFSDKHQNALAEDHINGYWAVSILEDNGDEAGADGYRHLHARLMTVLEEESKIITECRDILKLLGITSFEEKNLLENFTTLLMANGKILSPHFGKA